LTTPSSPHPTTKIFFKTLDALRFFSFFGVFLYHCYKVLFDSLRNTDPVYYNVLKFFFQHGNLGVNFFFVLSGFLITYLLITEKKVTGEIALRNFYIRRVLRIWPLFYLCVIIGFLIFPLLKTFFNRIPDENANPLYYLLYINNFDFINNWPLVPDALILVVLWSVAVEEQFYAAWPLVVKFVKSSKLVYAFLLVILLSLVFRWYHSGFSEKEYAIRYFHTFSLIGDMALGGLFALLPSSNIRLPTFVIKGKKGFTILVYTLSAIIIFFKDKIFVTPGLITFERLIIGTLFGLIIMEQSFGTNRVIEFSGFRKISKLGIYTYGLYCYHFLIISAVMPLKNLLDDFLTPVWTSALASIVALLLSILVSMISFYLFEKWFLKFKTRYSVVVKE
jgi:peptidoglycan/LPS O-acetylase OafA/YrhL